MAEPLEIDDRAGSGELKRHFDSLGFLRSRLCRLQYGDFAFTTPNGPDGECRVGVERKTIPEMVTLLTAGKAQRFAGSQLPGMLKEYRFPYLVVEGMQRPNYYTNSMEYWVKGKNGRPGRWRSSRLHYRALRNHLLTLELFTGIQVVTTAEPEETCEFVEALYFYFSKKWNQHGSHLRFPEVQAKYAVNPGMSLCRRMVKEISGVGWERAKEIQKRFGSMEGVMEAGVKDWALIDGITESRAKKIWLELRGLKGE